MDAPGRWRGGLPARASALALARRGRPEDFLITSGSGDLGNSGHGELNTRSRGRDFYAIVCIGALATGDLRSEVWGIMDGLDFDPR